MKVKVHELEPGMMVLVPKLKVKGVLTGVLTVSRVWCPPTNVIDDEFLVWFHGIKEACRIHQDYVVERVDNISRQISEALREALEEDFIEAIETGYYGDRFVNLRQDLSNCLTGDDILNLDATDKSKVLLSADGGWIDLDEVELASEEIKAITERLAANKEGLLNQPTYRPNSK